MPNYQNCAECKWSYPVELLSPLFINGSYTEPICGICAEKIIGHELHELAAKMKQDAIKWRRDRPNRFQ